LLLPIADRKSARGSQEGQRVWTVVASPLFRTFPVSQGWQGLLTMMTSEAGNVKRRRFRSGPAQSGGLVTDIPETL
jgi:hypothetical protein